MTAYIACACQEPQLQYKGPAMSSISVKNALIVCVANAVIWLRTRRAYMGVCAVGNHGEGTGLACMQEYFHGVVE